MSADFDSLGRQVYRMMQKAHGVDTPSAFEAWQYVLTHPERFELSESSLPKDCPSAFLDAYVGA